MNVQQTSRLLAHVLDAEKRVDSAEIDSSVSKCRRPTLAGNKNLPVNVFGLTVRD